MYGVIYVMYGGSVQTPATNLLKWTMKIIKSGKIRLSYYLSL